MSTMILQNAGGVAGSLIGGPVGGLIGGVAGKLAGSLAETALAGGRSPRLRQSEGPRLAEQPALTSSEGAPIPRLYGRARLGGELIWATRFQEEITVDAQGGGAAASTGGKSARKVKPVGDTITQTTSYSYYAHFAVGLCEGPIAYVRRVWADGRLIDLEPLTIRIYRGDEAQLPDPLILAKEGADRAPAYRGTAYIVFERLPLAEFGNRIPQLSFEVVRPMSGLAARLRAVDLIPGAGEFVYDPRPVSRGAGLEASDSENRHVLTHAADWFASLDALQALCPRLESVGLVVSWFGDDLRAGSCRVEPRVDRPQKQTTGALWTVAGLGRGRARPTSVVNGRAAYGGTPADASVLRAIKDLKARGIAVMLYPFLLMDVPPGNAKPDPWTGAPAQPSFPWRGRLTCDPAPGRPGSADLTSAAASQVAAFFGKAAVGDFSLAGENVIYRGNEWSLRRQVLHYAFLAKAAGGVSAFLIGSEFVGLTRLRGPDGRFPAVDALTVLAADVRAVLGPGVKISYAADWTEYGGFTPAPGELRFPLDPLWASPAVDFVGIDFYAPLSDWRDGTAHADAALARSEYDRDYLQSRFGAGEAYDWFYANAADRLGQRRTPITDGLGKPWVYRAKDLAGWWSNHHVERVGGIERAAPTPWLARSKPIWFTEIGCPAIDKGANAPNLFYDPKSSESAYPPFSRGFRDDLALARTLEAALARFDPSDPRHRPGDNPVSPIYGGPMVDPSRIHLWAWDARPFPAFPAFTDVWADGGNWEKGHWLTGRLEGVTLDALIPALLAEFGLDPPVDVDVDGFFDGYVIDRAMSARAALEPLAAAMGFDAVCSGPGLRFQDRRLSNALALALDDLVPGSDGRLFELTRTQEGELPRDVRLGFTDSDNDYRRAAVASRRLIAGSSRQAALDLALITHRAEAERLAERWLRAVWSAREQAAFQLRPGLIALEPGDLVSLPTDGARKLFRITRVSDAGARRVSAEAVDPAARRLALRAVEKPPAAPPAIAGPAFAAVIDWPGALADPAPLQSLAVFASPWLGPMTVWRSVDGASFQAFAAIPAPARIGKLASAFPPGPLWRWDMAGAIEIDLAGGALSAAGDSEALAGNAVLAVRTESGGWELIGFARAELIGQGRWRASRLLRGLLGSESAAARGAPAGALAVMLDSALLTLAAGPASVGAAWRYRISPAGRDHADPAAVEIAAVIGAEALRPLAPARLAARRGSDGITLSWIRRGRLDADGWDLVEIPLGEDAEVYEVEIYAGGGVLKRVLRVSEPRALYGRDAETADFAARQAELDIAVYQLSATVGRGAPARARIPIR